MATNRGSVRVQRVRTTLQKSCPNRVKGGELKAADMLCISWMLIVIGSKTKKSLGWFCNLDGDRSQSFNETSEIAILVDLTSLS